MLFFIAIIYICFALRADKLLKHAERSDSVNL
jgi:hypothetical protein